jgi:uncharacterized protein involved in type VI secretion and phage assembly
MSGDEIRQRSASTFRVEVDGNALPDDVEALMSYAVVEDNLHLPDMFYLAFLDPEHVVVGKAGFAMAAEVKVWARSEDRPGGDPVFTGEVTALERELDGGRTRTVVRGFDRSHRLHRGRRTRAFKDVTVADVVKEVVQAAGLEVGEVEEPQGRPQAHIAQANLTDAELLSGLAGEVGFVLTVDGGTVHFRAPTRSSDAPRQGDLAAQDPLQLVQGDNLLRFNATVTADSQVKEVSVRGWDVAAKRAIVGTAPAASTVAEVGVTPAGLAQAFGDPTFTATDVPYGETEQVEAASRALAEQIAGTFAQIEGVARGNPRLRAGRAVSLGLAGPPFEGKYTLTSTRHVYDNGEYLTWFSSTGGQERTLLGLASAGGGAARGASPALVTAPIPSVVSAVVTNVADDERQGRVKVKLPRLDDDFESGWLRVVQPGAGPGRGALVLPEVDDEVLVAFEQGDVRRGYVLGGVYNGVDLPAPAVRDGAVGSDGLVQTRSFTSRKGHFVVFGDADGDEYVELATEGSAFSVKVARDAEGGAVIVASDNVVRIGAGGDVTVAARGGVTIEATGDLTLSGRTVAIEATSTLQVKGQNVTVEGTATSALKGGRVSVAGSSALDLDGGANANLHAGLVRIN